MSRQSKIVILCIVGALVLLCIGFAIGVYYLKRMDRKNEQAETAQSSTSTTSALSATTNSAAGQSDWLEYKNLAIKYLIDYPKDAKLTDASAGNDKSDDISQSSCVKIATDNYYVIIGAKADEGSNNGCFRTGVGTQWSNGPTDSITMAGQAYAPEGMHTEAASAGTYEDFFTVEPVDGRVTVEYGTIVNEKNGTMTKQQAKDIVHKILASYSPAQ